MSKGSNQRPRQIKQDEFAARWDEVFKPVAMECKCTGLGALGCPAHGDPLRFVIEDEIPSVRFTKGPVAMVGHLWERERDG
jgi:hypothetical protein